MKVIIDNGHGADTPGKCSPDGTFREATYTRRLAAALSSGAAAIGYSGNRSSPPRGYWTGNFVILRDTLCPAVLSENMFMDNVADLAFLRSPRSVEILAALHAKVLAEIIPDL